MSKNRKGFLWRAAAALVLIGLLVTGGLAAYRAGWSQGYAVRQTAIEGQESAPMPYAPYFGHHLRFAPHMFGVGLLFKVLLLLAFFVIAGKLIRFVIWGSLWRFGMASPGPWRKRHKHAYWHRMHGPAPPWCWDWEEPAGKDAEQTEG